MYIFVGVLAKHSIMVRASIRLSLFCLSSCSITSSSSTINTNITINDILITKRSVTSRPVGGWEETLPKAQRTRGLSSGYQSNFFRSNHKFSNKSWLDFIFIISTKQQLQNLNQISAFRLNLNFKILLTLTKEKWGVRVFVLLN